MKFATEGLVRSVYAHIFGRTPNPDELRHWASVIETHGAQLFFELIYNSPEAQSVRRESEKKAKAREVNRFLRSCEKVALADRYLDDLIGQTTSRLIRVACFGFEGAALPAIVHRRLSVSKWISIVNTNHIGEVDTVDIAICGPIEISSIVHSKTAASLRADFSLLVLDGFSYDAWNASAFAFRIDERDFMPKFIDRLECWLGNEFVRHPVISGFSVSNEGKRHPAVLLERRKDSAFGLRLCEKMVQNSLAKVVLCHFLLRTPELACAALDDLDLRAGTNLLQQYSAIVGLIEQ